jgi:small nuclear ribonucleoprotein (snRNP)-like protein
MCYAILSKLIFIADDNVLCFKGKRKSRGISDASMNARFINKSTAFLLTALLLLSVEVVQAIQIKLNNGTVLIGDIISQDENSIVVQVGPSRLSIAKSMVTEIAGLRIGTAAAGTAPAAAPAQQPAAIVPRLDISAVTPGKKIEITLKNGAKFKGTVTAADDRLITLEMASGSRIDFYKSIIGDIGDYSSPSSGVQTTSAPAVSTPPAAATSAQTPAPSPAQTAAAGASLGAGAALPSGKKVEITLNNGARFKGTVIGADERLVTLEMGGGSRLSFYRTSILDISDLSQPPPSGVQATSAPAVSTPPAAATSAQTPAPSPAQTAAAGASLGAGTAVASAQTPVPSSVPAPSAGVSPASAAEASTGMEATARGKAVEITLKNGSKFKGTVIAADERLITLEVARGSRVDFNKSVVVAVRHLAVQAVSTGQVPAAPSPPATDRVSNIPSVAPAFPAAPLAPPAVTVVTNTVAPQKRQDTVPPPVASQPVVPPSVPVVQPQPAPAVPQSPEGKNVLVLKNGTVFRGAIVSANDRFITFSNSDGMAVNILRRFIKTVDGAPSVAATGTPSTYADTTSQVQTTGPAAAAAPEKSGAIAELVKHLSDTSTDIRKKAVADLGAIMDAAALPPLCTALKDNDPAVRKAAAETLGDLRDARAIAPLCAALLQEPVDSVKAAEAFSLKLHTEFPLLIGALDNNSGLVRENAAYILWLMTGKNLGNDKQSWVEWYAKGR